MPFPLPIANSAPPLVPRTRPRTVILASADSNFRRRLQLRLSGLRWQVREAESGAQAWSEAESSAPEAVIVDSCLPDLDPAEFLREFRGSFPSIDVLTSDGDSASDGPRSQRMSSLRTGWLHALTGTTFRWTARA